MCLNYLHVECVLKHSSVSKCFFQSYGKDWQLLVKLKNAAPPNLAVSHFDKTFWQNYKTRAFYVMDLKEALFKTKVFTDEWNCVVFAVQRLSAFFCNCIPVKKSHADYCCQLCCFKMFDCSCVSRLVTWLNRSEVMNEWSCGDGCFFWNCVFLQESLRGRPKEIPHNEKLLSLKYEVKPLLSSASFWLTFGSLLLHNEATWMGWMPRLHFSTHFYMWPIKFLLKLCYGTFYTFLLYVQ